jgi:signal transduction histidine kinase
MEPSRAELKYLVERQREEIKTLNAMARLLRPAIQSQEILHRVIAYLKENFPLALCLVLLAKERRLYLFRFIRIVPVDIDGAIREICSKSAERLSEPIQPDQLTILSEEDPNLVQWSEGPLGCLKSSHFIPLAFGEMLIGMMAVFSVKPNGFSDEDRHVMEIVADRLASALHNAFLLEELRRTDQMKTELLAILSHELRIPLTAIQEGTSLLSEGVLGELNAEQADFAKTILRNAHRLGRLIEKVELAYHILTDKISYRMDKVDLVTILKQLETAFLPMAESQHVALQLVPSQMIGTTIVQADAERLTQALSELIENALKATQEGGQVTASLKTEPNWIQLNLADTGCGFPMEALSKRSEEFLWTIGGIHERKTGGVGLGLFIAQRIVKAHQGKIAIQSEPGKGTQLEIRLPRVD